MPEYNVQIPLVGVASFVVTADSKDDAIAKCIESEFVIYFEDQPEMREEAGISLAEFTEAELVERVAEGNVCHHPCHQAYAEEVRAKKPRKPAK